MAMADTTPGKIYDIAEKLGYEGARTQSSAKGVYACADALGFVGPHARRITDALSDLKTVVGSGGGGVALGAGVTPECTYQGNDSLGFMIMGDGASIIAMATPDAQLMVPSGLTYLLGGFTNSGTPVSITSAADVSATKVVGEHSPTTFTDFTVVEVMGINAIKIETSAADEGYSLIFDIDPQ